MIGQISFNSYRPEAGQALAVHGAELDDDKIAEALKIRMREVSVFGEEPISHKEDPVFAFAEAFRPSHAFPGSSGERTSNYEDGETFLYLAAYDGDGHAFVGREKQIGDRAVLLKIGVTNNLQRRCAELNSGIPPAAKGKWVLRYNSQAFPDKKSAEVVEDQFKEQCTGKLESFGGEFFWGQISDAETVFWSLPGMARFHGKS